MEINGKNYELKYSLRSMFIWEEITGKSFEINTLFDTYIFAYSCLLANPENPQIEFNEFIDACDKDSSIIEEFNQYIENEMKKRNTFNKDKKKVTQK